MDTGKYWKRYDLCSKQMGKNYMFINLSFEKLIIL